MISAHHLRNVKPILIHQKQRGGSMRAKILPWAIILTKAHRAAVSMMVKGCIAA